MIHRQRYLGLSVACRSLLDRLKCLRIHLNVFKNFGGLFDPYLLMVIPGIPRLHYSTFLSIALTRTLRIVLNASHRLMLRQWHLSCKPAS